MDIVKDVIAHYGGSGGGRDGVVLLGSDWGAGIALSTAMTAPALVRKLVLYNVTYTEQASELSHVKCPVRLLWTKGDQFHPVAWATKLAQRIKRCVLTMFPQGSRLSPAVLQAMREEIVGSTKAPATATAGGRAKARRSKSQPPVRDTSKLAPGATTGAAAAAALVPGPAPTQRSAVEEFRCVWAEGKLPELYAAMSGRGDSSLHGGAVRLFSGLPVLSPATLSSPQVLVASGLWPAAPTDWAGMDACERYPVGRRVLVRAPVCDDPQQPNAFLKLQPRLQGPLPHFVSPYATVANRVDARMTLHMPIADATGAVAELDCPLAELQALNDPTGYKRGGRSAGDDSASACYLFEDGVRCEYTAPLMRARLCEMALCMAHYVDGLRFDADRDQVPSAPMCLLARCMVN